MRAGINPMSTLPRPRTRNQWDEHYKNLYCKSGGLGRRDKGVKNDGKDSWEKQGFVIIGERRGFKRTRNVVESSASPSDLKGHVRKRVDEEEKNNVASVGRVLRGKKILDVRSDTDSDGVLKSDDDDIEFLGVLKSDDDGIEFLGEKVESNGSSLKNGENGVKRGRGRPRIKPLDDERIEKDVSVKDSENLSNSESDASDDLSLSEDESTSEEDDEFSDEDYKASTSDSSYVSYYGSDDDEQEKKDGAIKNVNVTNEEEDNSSDAIKDKTTVCSHGKSVRVKEEKESDTEQEENDESDDDSSNSRRCSNQRKRGGCGDYHNRLDDKFPSFRKSRRTIGKKESEVEQERDDGIRKGRHVIYDEGFCNKTSANWKTEDEVIKLPSIRMSSRINQNGDAELTGLARSDKSCSMKKARKDGFKDNGKDDLNFTKCYKPTTFPKFQKKDLEFGKFISSPFPIPKSGKSAFSMDNKFKSLRDEDSCHIERVSEEKEFKFSKKRNSQERTLDLIKILVQSINSMKDDQFPIEENDLMTQSTLPLRFRFEDEVKPPYIKSDWEKEMDSLFGDLELGLRESEIECTNNPSVTEDDDTSPEIDQSPAACCGRGEHEPILDEQIGIICKYCAAVILDIKYVLPPFYTPPLSRRDWRDYDESPSNVFSEFHFRDSCCKTPEPTRPARGTVWDLIAGVENELYPHQREGFKFMWKNIAGDIMIENMKYPLSGGRGCIISHAPGTGKTRLTIVFLQAFLKLYPTCRPIIIAPKGMLLTWESEFIKWNANIPFHNLNKKELSENEYSFAAEIIGQVGGKMSKDCVRILKLASWMFGKYLRNQLSVIREARRRS
ncbi:hypothetical protein DH2020_047068 [Rehmannia glutinosa]|uniref:SNF2 N-terminal domain-containing protein n=1 Tax=Rehmannia glutinosa TaxID=99300 RepID=A0ABR0U9P7_REHGL